MKIIRFTASPDGGYSHFVELDLAIDNASTDAWGNTSHRSATLPAQSTMATEMPEGLYQDWHPASRRPASCRAFRHTGGRNQRRGNKYRCSSGDDDVGSRGNRTAQSAARPGCCSFICRPKP